jgi:predicted AlkP superfamily pyrophosphatase or phosphodiesterase
MIAEDIVTAEQLRTFENSSQAWQDEMWTAAAVKILKEHHPNLLLFHLLTVDDLNHEYAPMSPASLTAMALVDSYVKQVVDLLKTSGLAQKTTLIIVSDHGFRPIKHKIHPNVLLREKGLLTGAADTIKGDAWVLSTGGTAMVYITNSQKKATLIPELRRILNTAEGVDRVYVGDELAKLGLPVPSATDQGPDLVLSAKPDYVFSNEADGDYLIPATGGTHGYLNTDPAMQAIFIAWGAGIPRGVHLDKLSNLDIAPSIAALLGLEMKTAKGTPIEAIVLNTPDKSEK